MTQAAGIESVLMIADVARAIDDFRSLPETLDRICECVRGLSDCHVTALLLPDAGAGALVIEGSAGMSPAYVEHINRDHPLRLDDVGPLSRSPTVSAYHSGEPLTIPDVEHEPTFASWRGGARLQGYRSLACIPVIVRARVIGVLNCYGQRPHEHSTEEIELLQLVARMAGVAIETARAADAQRDTAEQLRRLSDRLQEKNAELERLTAIQSRLAETLAAADLTAVERTAATLAETTGRSVLVWARGGHPLAYAGVPEDRDAMALVGVRSAVERSLRDRPRIDADGCTCLRIGSGDAAAGVLVVRPAIADDNDVAMLAARHASAVMAGELQGERATRMLETYALPAILLALVHGLHGPIGRQEAAGVLRVEPDAELRLAVLRCGSPEEAYRLSRRLDALRQAGWPARAAAADDADVLLLLVEADRARIERAAATTRDRHAGVLGIGVSDPVVGLGALLDARRRALVAAAANRETATAATRFDELRGLGDVAQRLPPAVARELVQGTLGPLRAYDAAHGTELVATLHAYVDQGGRPRETAAALHIHPNTLQQRLRRCAELGGFDVRDLRDLGRVVLALDWDRLLSAGAVDRVAARNGAAAAAQDDEVLAWQRSA